MKYVSDEQIAQLRHLYANLMNGGVRDTASAKRIATGLLGPVIEVLELCDADAGPWKVGNEYLPYHPSASHAPPDLRDCWNRCYWAGHAYAEQAVKQERERCKTMFSLDLEAHREGYMRLWHAYARVDRGGAMYFLPKPVPAKE